MSTEGVNSTDPLKVRPSERQLMWQNLELTAFFHYGINTFSNREWGKGTEDPVLFNPSDQDCRQWVRTVKEAGFKLAILTAKHHDGFCLWQSSFSEHSVQSSPWKEGKGDVLREFTQACREYGVLPGVYLSPWDRNSAVYGTEAYNDYFVDQLTEVLTGYGPFYEVWFDGACGEGSNGKKQIYDWNRYYKVIRKIAPQAAISICGPDIRWVGNEHGYGHKTEWNVVPSSLFDQGKIEEELIWYPAEVDVSIRPGWFYHRYQNFMVKSHSRLVDIYYSSVGMGSGLLLNIPPDRQGKISSFDRSRLRKVTRTLAKTFDSPVVSGFLPLDSSEGERQIFEIRRDHNFSFDRVLVQEEIAEGQFVEEFEIHYQTRRGYWNSLSSGTTIGYKRILRTRPVKTKAVRLIIRKSRSTPRISCFELYKSSRDDRCLVFRRDQ